MSWRPARPAIAYIVTSHVGPFVFAGHQQALWPAPREKGKVGCGRKENPVRLSASANRGSRGCRTEGERPIGQDRQFLHNSLLFLVSRMGRVDVLSIKAGQIENEGIPQPAPDCIFSA